jgi:predicted deacylase
VDVTAVLQQQLQMTSTTWAALQEHGVSEGDTRAVDAFFVAPDERSATALVAALQERGVRAEARPGRKRLLRRTEFMVSAEDPGVVLSLPSLRSWVTAMVELGAAHTAEFDGWGASA